jgi:pimeloyl-ACP methyl ester carboxylesterase
MHALKTGLSAALLIACLQTTVLAADPAPALPNWDPEAKPWLVAQPKLVKRRFADLAEGQVHYWHAAPPKGSPGARKVPLIFLHPGPHTARVQTPLLDILAEERPVYAPDLMGMGDSSPPAFPGGKPPELAYYADAVVRFADTLGLKTFDVMGSSLGGYVAIEIAASRPERVKHLLLNRLNIQTGELLEQFKKYHVPKVVPDQSGMYVTFLWSRLRDLYTYVPWFKHEAANLRGRGMAPAEIMHIAFTEQVKMATTSYLAFDAYWRYPLEERLAGVKVRTTARDDGVNILRAATLWNPKLAGDVIEASEPELRQFAAEVHRQLDK